MKNVLRVLLTVVLVVLAVLLVYCAMIEPRLSFIWSNAPSPNIETTFLAYLLIKPAALMMTFGVAALINCVWTGKRLVPK